MAALWRSIGRRSRVKRGGPATHVTRWVACGGALVVAMLVAAAIAPATPALVDDDWTGRPHSVITAVAASVAAGHSTAAHPADPARRPPAHMSIATGADPHGILRSTRLLVAGAEAYAGGIAAVPVAFPVAFGGAPARAIVANSLLLLAAAAGPVATARHTQGHLRT